ncbi:MAG: PDZ domain-containing protein [Bradymonadales bacterium]|nr:PDZ domain-containing protein [Bradymonadales bacterium]
MKPRLLAILATLLVSSFAAAQTSEPQTDGTAPVQPRLLPDDDQGGPYGGSTGRLGVLVVAMTPELRAHFGAPQDAGVLVSRVEPDSAAQAAGIQVGDVIVQVAGQNIASPDLLVQAVMTRPGQVVDLTIVRQGQVMIVTPEIQAGPSTGHQGWWFHGPPGFWTPGGPGQDPSDLPPELQQLLEQLQQQMQEPDRSDRIPWPLIYHYAAPPSGTRGGELDDRLESIEERLRALERRMQ